MTIEREYEYEAKWSTIVLGTLFFGACAGVLGATARDNDRGLVINGIVELSRNGATFFYLGLALTSVLFVALFGLMAVVRLTLRQRIAFSETCLIVPRSRWSSNEVVVPFHEIRTISKSEVAGQHFLKIVHASGKFTLNASLCPSWYDFDEICRLIAQRATPHGPRPG